MQDSVKNNQVSENEVTTSSVEQSNLNGINLLNINFKREETTATKSNQPALDILLALSTKGYYFVAQPKNNRNGEAYLWITATKQGEDREEFALYVNDDVLNVLVSILTGKTANTSKINADDLVKFNERITNFEYVLFVTEKAQGRTMKKTYTTNGQVFSSYYKRGVISYKPYLNPELKAYLNA